MPLTETQFSQQMVAQLRLLNPNYSAEVGTPERWIIDTVAEALADSQIDLIGLENALNIDTKFGANLDNFVGLFGFARKQASKATGFVVFSRTAPLSSDIVVPVGVLLQTNQTEDGRPVQYGTSSSITLSAGQLTTAPVPILALNPGSGSNVEANAVTVMAGEVPFGVTEVTNPSPITGGSNQEDDNSLKVRFKNTIFRNLAGTKDQFLALAISTAFSKKANVVGPVSQYKEYIQLPKTDDSEAYNFGGGIEAYSGKGRKFAMVASNSTTTLTVPSTTNLLPGEKVLLYTEPTLGESEKAFEGTISGILSETTLKLSGTPSPTVTNGLALIGEVTTVSTEWTSALSSIPYAKNIWTEKPVFITNGQTGIANYFFREGVDFEFNFPARIQGDTARALIDGVGLNPETSELAKLQPNITFTNVYTGGNEAVQAVTPEQVVLLEYSYTSSSSRNSLVHNVTNCVDVFVDGSNEQPTNTIFAVGTGLTGRAFVENPVSPYYVESYRRSGEPVKRPIVGNILTTLMAQPLLSLPEQIQVTHEGEINFYYLGTHYWLVRDVSEYAGTIRARDGIEWSAALVGDITNLGPIPAPVTRPPKTGDPALADPPAYKGTSFLSLSASTPVEIVNYTYDKNVPDLQATLDSARQITTDVLAHSARTRYFKLDITVIYEPTISASTVNNQIQNTLDIYLKSQFFGAAINLSDLLQQVHSVSGVNNVRWTSDVPKAAGTTRVYETDINGLPLLGATIDRIIPGNGTTKEVQRLFITGKPTTGPIFLTYNIAEAPVVVELTKIEGKTATEIKTAITAATGLALTVTEDSKPTKTQDFSRSFTLTYTSTATQTLPIVTTGYLEGEHVFSEDFFLRDNELPALPTGMQTIPTKILPADAVPGLIIRPRAQGTWLRAN